FQDRVIERLFREVAPKRQLHARVQRDDALAAGQTQERPAGIHFLFCHALPAHSLRLRLQEDTRPSLVTSHVGANVNLVVVWGFIRDLRLLHFRIRIERGDRQFLDWLGVILLRLLLALALVFVVLGLLLVVLLRGTVFFVGILVLIFVLVLFLCLGEVRTDF